MQFSMLRAFGIAILAICAGSGVALAEFTQVTNSFTVNIGSDFEDPTPENNDADDTDQPNVIDLIVSKELTVRPTTIIPGDSANNALTYIVSLENRGLVPAAGLTFTDQFEGTGVDNALWSCATNSVATPNGCSAVTGATDSNINWTGMTINPGETVTIQLNVTLGADFVGNGSGGDFCAANEMENRAALVKTAATVTDIDGAAGSLASAPYEIINIDDDALADNAAHVCVGATKRADVAGAKTDGLNFFTPGETTEYKLRVFNFGPSVATGVSFVDTLPGGIETVNSFSCEFIDTTGVTTTTSSAGFTITPTLTGPLYVPAGNENDVTVSTPALPPQTSPTTGWSSGANGDLPDFDTQLPDHYVECSVNVTWSTNMDYYDLE